jgi:hypothetical protein
MVQQVVIPLDVLNDLPVISGVDPVEFSIPTFDDIEEIVVENTVSAEEIADEVGDVAGDVIVGAFEATLLDELVDLIGDSLEVRVELGEQALDAIAGQVIDGLQFPDLEDTTIDVEGSLFSVGEDFVELLATALDEADLSAVGGFPDIDSLEDLLSELEETLLDPLLGEADTLLDLLQENIQDVIEELPNGDLLTELDDVVDSQIDRVTDGLVSEESRENLEQAVEDIL